jgi:hypothetical protein
MNTKMNNNRANAIDYKRVTANFWVGKGRFFLKNGKRIQGYNEDCCA